MFIKIVSVLQFLIGLFFLFNTKSDIQLGFAVILMTQALANYAIWLLHKKKA